MRHRFVMIMPYKRVATLMSALILQCSNELLSTGIGWWIGVEPATADARGCSKVSGWLTGEVAVATKSEMFRHFAAAFTSATSLAFDNSTTFTVLSTWNAALATVVGQSLLSPVLGTLTDAMGQRLQVAIFPTYVTPDVKSKQERTSGRVPPTFTLVTEFGVDLTDQFDLSVLAAPNTTDVPPQATLSYRLTPNTTVSGAVDANGTWQSQLQVFFRF